MEKFNCIADENIRIDKFIASHLEGVTRSHIQKLIDEGNVLVDGKNVKSKKSFIPFITNTYNFITNLLNNLKYMKIPNIIDTNIYTRISSSKNRYIAYDIIQNIIIKYIIS